MSNLVTMNQNQCLLFIQLRDKAQKVDYAQLGVAWSYPDRLDAERLSILLKNVGLLNGFQEKKRVWTFINGAPRFNITVKNDQFETIANTYEKYYTNFLDFRKRDSAYDDKEEETKAWSSLDEESIQLAIQEIDKELPHVLPDLI